uniref:Putative secreted protein n=1 Tax=Rhipicephalus microplus TaxID=6941 RepID=A0A6M2DBP4_RHIMP
MFFDAKFQLLELLRTMVHLQVIGSSDTLPILRCLGLVRHSGRGGGIAVYVEEQLYPAWNTLGMHLDKQPIDALPFQRRS